VTETLFYIGAGDAVVGASDYCDFPPAAATLPKAGTSLTPSHEAIARLKPSLIVGVANETIDAHALASLGNVHLLPWLTLTEIAESVRYLGRVTNRTGQADQLAQRLVSGLSSIPPDSAPKTLLVLGYEPDKLDEVWFIRDDSIHGAVLRAAGVRNAVEHAVAGIPRLSLEQVVRLDPEVIIVLSQKGPEQRGPVLRAWRSIEPLSAVRNGKLAVK
jgi:iron complex transport system substrate-binding protein